LAAAALLWAPGRSQLLVLAVAMPVLLGHDALRHVAIARGRPEKAAFADGLWVALYLAAAAALVVAGGAGATSLLAAWAGAGAVSTAAAAATLGVRPDLRGAGRWLGDNAVTCRRVGLEFAANSGAYYALSFGLAALAGAAQLGYFRAAQTLFGPASVVLMGGAALGVPESVRIGRTRAELLRFAARLSGGLTLLSLACGLAVWAALPVFGPHLLAESWRPVRAVMPWLTLFGAAIGAGAGAVAGLRALDAARWLMGARAAASALALAAGLPAAWLWGARGTLAALAAAECVLAARAWAQLRSRA
ncbi:MAG: hypothetical protein AB1673_17090, partial [Actinomycetota bacterium]